MMVGRTGGTEGSELPADPEGILWHGPPQTSSRVGAMWCGDRQDQSEGEKNPTALLGPLAEEPESLTTVK